MLVFLSLLCIVGVIRSTPPCQRLFPLTNPTEFPFNGHCYVSYYPNIVNNQDVAEHFCQEYMPGFDTHLVSVHSEAENDFLKSLHQTNEIWIGLMKTGDSSDDVLDEPWCLYWTDGSPVDYFPSSGGYSISDKCNQEICFRMENNLRWWDYQCNANSFTYVCKYKIPTCFGIPGNNTVEVCSGRGECTGNDTCTSCLNDYYGPQCSNFSCNSIDSTNSLTCSGHGICIGPDTCNCSEIYSGVFCDTCAEDDYFGDECTEFKCYNHDRDSKEVCSGFGKCIQPDVCNCTQFHSGKYCQNEDLIFYIAIGSGSLAGIVLVVLLLCICCVFCLFYAKKKRDAEKFQKYKNIRNIEMILDEHLAENDGNMANIRVDKSLFEIKYEDVELISECGRGGSDSTIYKVRWKGIVAAFKVFKTKDMKDQDYFDDFEKEVSIISSVSHPNILQYYGCTIKPPRIGIVMEFCENGTLKQYISLAAKGRVEPLIPTQKIDIYRMISSGMEYLSERDIIHRDLKNSNILLDGNLNPKIIDFGTSRTLDRTMTGMSQRKADMTKQIGTSGHIAPEVTIGGQYDCKCDVYSFSIVMYTSFFEIWSPYGRNLPFNIDIKVCMDPIFRPKIPTLKTDEYKWFVSLIQDCWEHDPDNRPTFSQIKNCLTTMTYNYDLTKEEVKDYEKNLIEKKEEERRKRKEEEKKRVEEEKQRLIKEAEKKYRKRQMDLMQKQREDENEELEKIKDEKVKMLKYIEEEMVEKKNEIRRRELEEKKKREIYEQRRDEEERMRKKYIEAQKRRKLKQLKEKEMELKRKEEEIKKQLEVQTRKKELEFKQKQRKMERDMSEREEELKNKLRILKESEKEIGDKLNSPIKVRYQIPKVKIYQMFQQKQKEMVQKRSKSKGKNTFARNVISMDDKDDFELRDLNKRMSTPPAIQRKMDDGVFKDFRELKVKVKKEMVKDGFKRVLSMYDEEDEDELKKKNEVRITIKPIEKNKISMSDSPATPTEKKANLFLPPKSNQSKHLPPKVTKKSQPAPPKVTKRSQPKLPKVTKKSQPAPPRVAKRSQPAPPKVTKRSQPKLPKVIKRSQPAPPKVNKRSNQPALPKVKKRSQPSVPTNSGPSLPNRSSKKKIIMM